MTYTQLMGELPQARSRPAPTFSQVGVDPVSLKLGHTRKPVIVKAYIGLFICLVTKAVHIEMVSDLSTDAILAAFHRFVAFPLMYIQTMARTSLVQKESLLTFVLY